jgi:hypothetical protein
MAPRRPRMSRIINSTSARPKARNAARRGHSRSARRGSVRRRSTSRRGGEEPGIRLPVAPGREENRGWPVRPVEDRQPYDERQPATADRGGGDEMRQRRLALAGCRVGSRRRQQAQDIGSDGASDAARRRDEAAMNAPLGERS